MFLPLGDRPNPKGYQAYVNYALIAANIAVYALVTLPHSLAPIDPSAPEVQAYLRHMLPNLPPGTPPEALLQRLSAYDLVVFAHGYIPAAPEWSDLLTSMFLHGGFLHLAGNMLFLWIYGDNVEHRLGRVRYLLVYLLSGALATWTFAWMTPQGTAPLVGASGAISGVLGLYFVLFPRNQVKLFVALFPILFEVIYLPARWVLGAYVLLDNLLPLLTRTASSVAYGAHLGGFAAGVAAAFWAKRYGLPHPRRGAEAQSTQDLLRSAVQRAKSSRDEVAVLNLAEHAPLEELLRLPPEALIPIAEGLLEEGALAASDRILRQVVRRPDLPSPLRARGLLLLGELRLMEGQPTSAYQYLVSALELTPDADTRTRAGIALRQIMPQGT